MTDTEQSDIDVVAVVERIAEVADWIERDRREPDKVLCNVQSLRRLGSNLLAGVYRS